MHTGMDASLCRYVKIQDRDCTDIWIVTTDRYGIQAGIIQGTIYKDKVTDRYKVQEEMTSQECRYIIHDSAV